MRFSSILTAGTLALYLAGPAVGQRVINLDLQGGNQMDANVLTVDDPWKADPPDGIPSLRGKSAAAIGLNDPLQDQWNYLDLNPTNDSFGQDPLASTTITNLLDVNGVDTGITWTLLEDLFSMDGGTRSEANGPQGPGKWPNAIEPDDTLRDTVHVVVDQFNPDTYTLDWKLSGLKTDGTTYDVVVLAANIWNRGSFTVELGGPIEEGGIEKIVENHSLDGVESICKVDSGVPTFCGYDGAEPITEGQQYVVFKDVLPDEMGEVGVRQWTGDLTDPSTIATTYLSAVQLVENAPSSLQADFDKDGDVDGRDFLVWQRGFGTTYNANDLANWQSEYGSPGGILATLAVPEPTAATLISVVGIALCGMRFRTKREVI